jgi:hypothetical protein
MAYISGFLGHYSIGQERGALIYESEGRRFESCRARHRKPRKSRGFALEIDPFFLTLIVV